MMLVVLTFYFLEVKEFMVTQICWNFIDGKDRSSLQKLKFVWEARPLPPT